MSYYLTERQALARRRLQELTERYWDQKDTSVRHKCFLSYHAADSEKVLKFVEDFNHVFIPKAIGISDSDPFVNSTDTNYVMQAIRDKYLSDSTVTLVLLGTCTWARRYVDWEIYSSLRRSSGDRINGLLGISLKDSPKRPDRLTINISGENQKNGYARHISYPSNSDTLKYWIEDAFQARRSRSDVRTLGGPRKMNSSPCP